MVRWGLKVVEVPISPPVHCSESRLEDPSLHTKGSRVFIIRKMNTNHQTIQHCCSLTCSVYTSRNHIQFTKVGNKYFLWMTEWWRLWQQTAQAQIPAMPTFRPEDLRQVTLPSVPPSSDVNWRQYHLLSRVVMRLKWVNVSSLVAVISCSVNKQTKNHHWGCPILLNGKSNISPVCPRLSASFLKHNTQQNSNTESTNYRVECKMLKLLLRKIKPLVRVLSLGSDCQRSWADTEHVCKMSTSY